MHAPELWGIVQFSEDAAAKTTPVATYDRWPSGSAAMAVYYAQKAYAAANGGKFTGEPKDLLPHSASPFELCQSADVAIELHESGTSYLATVSLPQPSPWSATISHERLLKFVPVQQSLADPGAQKLPSLVAIAGVVWSLLMGK
mmetsp:Transcript_37605/g.106224  ORF Transcript_37605/g.106224 Transcript_37605/m.106224 type:complete len:144 (-) Transcript_37605:62-493(-)